MQHHQRCVSTELKGLHACSSRHFSLLFQANMTFNMEGLKQTNFRLQGGASPSSTAGSEQSETFVCDMTSANEPLYGDPGEEEAYQY